VKIAIASDHAGIEERLALAMHLRESGHEILDLGCEPGQSVDYPDYGAKVGRAVVSGEAERGVLVCGTGIGISMAANKIDGVRAALVYDDFTAEMSRRHNDANVVCMGARIHAVATMCRLLDRFLATPFDGGRHAGRVAKIMALEGDDAQIPS
jgi:ribose 5-phosphate isomerase B